MSTLSTDEYDVLIFDCYGTLVDWQTAISSYWQSVLTKHDAHVTDEFLLSFHAQWEPVEQNAGGLYRDVLKRVMNRLGDRLAFTPSAEELDGFVDSLANSRPFDDSIEAIEKLKEHFELAIVSNTDLDLLKQTLNPFTVEFDYLCTADQTGAYKPTEEMMSQAMTLIGPDKRKLHVAQSLFHDIKPANDLSNDSVWINRDGDSGSNVWLSDAKPTWTYDDLQTFADEIVGD